MLLRGWQGRNKIYNAWIFATLPPAVISPPDEKIDRVYINAINGNWGRYGVNVPAGVPDLG